MTSLLLTGSFATLSNLYRSHGALCFSTATDLTESVPSVLYGESQDQLTHRTRIRCKVKSTFSETRLVPALNDLLIANPSPAAVSRFRMGWLHNMEDESNPRGQPDYGTITRFAGIAYDVERSLNVWSSGMWLCTSTGSTAAMAGAGGKPMDVNSTSLQYLIREHMMENSIEDVSRDVNNGLVVEGQKMHLRWNSQRGRIFIDGSHLTHNLELGDEIMIDNQAPPLQMFVPKHRMRPST
jgi:NAD+ kinase